MVDKAEMDERLEQLNREWQCKYKELDDAWRRYLNNFAEETHREIAKVVGEGVATVIRDIETVDKIGRAIQAGFARLRAIDDLRTACGVDMRPDRTTSRPTTTSTGSILKSHRSGIAKTDPKEAYKVGFDAGYDCAITEARQIVGDLTDRLAEDRKKYRAELKTLQADIEQSQAKIEQQPDPPPRLN
jgi:hypothetical protein